jgi:hypothetical protein
MHSRNKNEVVEELTIEHAGGGEEGMEEAESSDTRIEALSVQVSRLMALMQSLQEIDAGAMRRLEAR